MAVGGARLRVRQQAWTEQHAIAGLEVFALDAPAFFGSAHLVPLSALFAVLAMFAIHGPLANFDLSPPRSAWF
jgi:hypothetical protein